MTIRVDSNSLIPGSIVVGGTGLGVLKSSVPGTGTSGASYLFNDPGGPNDEVMGQILQFPTVGDFFANEDGSFTFLNAPDGTYTIPYRGFINGTSYGDFEITITIGDVSRTGTLHTRYVVSSSTASRKSSHAGMQQALRFAASAGHRKGAAGGLSTTLRISQASTSRKSASGTAITPLRYLSFLGYAIEGTGQIHSVYRYGSSFTTRKSVSRGMQNINLVAGLLVQSNKAVTRPVVTNVVHGLSSSTRKTGLTQLDIGYGYSIISLGQKLSSGVLQNATGYIANNNISAKIAISVLENRTFLFSSSYVGIDKLNTPSTTTVSYSFDYRPITYGIQEWPQSYKMPM